MNHRRIIKDEIIALQKMFLEDKVLESLNFQLNNITRLAMPRYNLSLRQMELVFDAETQKAIDHLEEEKQMHIDKYYKPLFQEPVEIKGEDVSLAAMIIEGARLAEKEIKG